MKNVRNIVNVIIVMMICFVGYGQEQLVIIHNEDNDYTGTEGVDLFRFDIEETEETKTYKISENDYEPKINEIFDEDKVTSITKHGDKIYGNENFVSEIVINDNVVSINILDGIEIINTITFIFDEENTASTKDEQSINFNVYPNPVVNVLNIDVEQNTEVEIYNMNGQMIYTVEVNSMTTNQIDVSDYDNGIYIVKIGNVTKKIVR